LSFNFSVNATFQIYMTRQSWIILSLYLQCSANPMKAGMNVSQGSSKLNLNCPAVINHTHSRAWFPITTSIWLWLISPYNHDNYHFYRLTMASTQLTFFEVAAFQMK